MCMFFFFNDTATAEIYSLSLHDALPISRGVRWPATTSARCSRTVTVACCAGVACGLICVRVRTAGASGPTSNCARARCGCWRSEEHTSELQSRQYIACRLLLDKKKLKLK